MFPPRSTTALAALILSGGAAVVDALGQAIVVNNCNVPAYLWSVSNTQGPMNTLSPNGGTFSETYQINPDGGGISIKIAEQPTLSSPIIQLEYTFLDTLWYDLSRINGSPFAQDGITLDPSSSSPSCKAVDCVAGGMCGAGSVFYQPYDTTAIADCDPDSNLVLTLCTGSDQHRGGSGRKHHPAVPAPAPSPPPALAPDHSPAPSPAPTVAPPLPQPNQVITTLITEYVTVFATTDKIVTVTA